MRAAKEKAKNQERTVRLIRQRVLLWTKPRIAAGFQRWRRSLGARRTNADNASQSKRSAALNFTNQMPSFGYVM